MTQAESKEADRFLKFKELQKMVPLSRTTFWRMQRRKEFPAPCRVGGLALWRLSEVQRWFDSRPKTRGPAISSSPLQQPENLDLSGNKSVPA